MKVPQLRFKEFSGEWEEKTIKSMTSLLKDGSHGTHKDFPESDYLLLSAKNIINDKIEIYDNDRRISKEDYHQIYKNYSLKNGDIILTIVGTIGRTAIVNNLHKVAFQRSVAFFRFDNYNSNYIFQLFHTKNFVNELEKRKVVSAQPGIYLGDLSKIKLNIPSKQEQEKIASFLSSLDTKIEQLTKKAKLLSEYKKGTMQKIFSQEIRFSPKGTSSQAQGEDENGKNYPNWEEEELGNLISIISKKFNPKTNCEIKKCIELENLSQGTGQLLDYVYSNEQESIKNSFEKSQILFGKLRPYLKKFWKANFDGVCSSEIWVLSSIKVLNEYLLYLIQTKKFNDIANVSSGSKMPRSDWKYMSVIPFKYPSKEEQTKIANFLSSIDTKIEQNQKALEKTKEFKKALLQQMFV